MQRDSSTVEFHTLAGVFLSSIDAYMCLVCVPVGMCECVCMCVCVCVCVCGCAHVWVCAYRDGSGFRYFSLNIEI